MLTLKVCRKYLLTSHIVAILQGHGDTKRKTVKKTVKKTGKKALPRSGQRAGSNTSKKNVSVSRTNYMLLFKVIRN